MADLLSEPTLVQTVSWQALLASLKAHYALVPSKFIQKYEFRQWLQREGEPISTYMATLSKGATHCEYRDLDDALLEQLICSVRDIPLQRRLLARSNLMLHIALDEARAHESSTKAAETLQTASTIASDVKVNTGAPRGNPDRQQGRVQQRRLPNRKAQKGAERASRELCELQRFPSMTELQVQGRHLHCDKRGHLARVCRASLSSNHKQRSGASQSEPVRHKRTNKDGDSKKGANFWNHETCSTRVGQASM
ncbi:uncharacterized protein LOC117664876 [Pantherophis guttatus]|uniref:Uncharacterized protein LOC117664876 n=1 Tax=Pantherophis guttatus TaxID=94885 RepID=A0A6P9BWK9_PANGU|nr:uncharacterized protein LOC117664876 [Pantherophis guttatus]XP_034272141.1 uncharacterized protein LOC117664876 [Pantherophis guttatus]XP_060547734.1 uncharacterized protein LOC117664876 [Pantherophis guttatus]